jgi:ATP-dependent exoDNAse (exonuclease V) alpha subunit
MINFASNNLKRRSILPEINKIISRYFPFTPTKSQQKFFKVFQQFMENKDDKPAMMLKGYAGTGKTTIVSTLVKVLPLLNFKFMLLAPTGRAAKVMSSYSKKRAFTIHKIIFKTESDPEQGVFAFSRAENRQKKTVYIVDEASMLSDEHEFGSKGVLGSLIEYIFSQSDNRLILIGDDAQLPPVHQTKSPGLEKLYLQSRFKLSVFETELVDVMRQDLQSGILFNATHLRELIPQKDWQIKLTTKSFKDVYRMNGEKMEDGLRYAYDKYGTENTIIICRSNKLAVNYNRYIRQVVHFYENELEAGDMLMVVKNNYYFLGEDSKANFLANGEMVEVMKIVRFEELYGKRFATLQLRLIDFPEEPSFEAKVLLDTLYSNTASLSSEENRTFYQEVMNDYLHLDSKKKIREAMSNDPYLNALQVKFAYALTCHKAQGGQWNAVFVDQGYLTDEMVNQEYLRWLYTAVTRATDELFLVNFKATFFG